MRVLALVLAAGVSSSAILSARDASTVLSDIATIDSDVKSLTTSVNNYNSIADAQGLITAESNLDTAIKQGTSDAQATSTLSDSDATSILTAIKNLIPDIVDALNAVVSKSSTFSSTGVSSVVSGDLTQLKSDTDSFGSALISIAPSASLAAASAALSCIDQAFVAAEATSSVSGACTTDIVIGSGGSSVTSTSAPASSTPSSSGTSSPTSGSSSKPAGSSTTSAPSSSLASSTASSKSSSLTSAAGSSSASKVSSGAATGTGTGVVSTSSTAQFTGAASSLDISLTGAALFGALAFAL